MLLNKFDINAPEYVYLQWPFSVFLKGVDMCLHIYFSLFSYQLWYLKFQTVNVKK